ncbi:MAG: hypothetical protein KDA97_08685 [Acidimicrobiales bacterium]|nr:hypothetical protein [Acidimicrobiales bacterium]
MADPASSSSAVPAAERAFYVEEFAGATIVVALSGTGSAALDSLAAASAALASGGSRLLLVVAAPDADAAAARLPAPPVRLGEPDGATDLDHLAELWLAITDQREVVVAVAPGREATVAAALAEAVRAHKLVITDAGGGWGRPPRSFADVVTHAAAFRDQLADRQGGAVLDALEAALRSGVTNVNLCRPDDLDRELFTFDGAGTLFTSGGYVELGRLRVDDLPAVEGLVAQGTADGLLRPRSRLEVARLAVGGLGARVVGSGHLAGIVALDAETYRAEGLGEVSCLYTVSRLSGTGAGSLLVDGLLAVAGEAGLRDVFAVTVSEAAAAFFIRKGFAEVDPEHLPERKWATYDPERRARARVFIRPAATVGEQGTLGF